MEKDNVKWAEGTWQWIGEGGEICTRQFGLAYNLVEALCATPVGTMGMYMYVHV